MSSGRGFAPGLGAARSGVVASHFGGRCGGYRNPWIWRSLRQSRVQRRWARRHPGRWLRCLCESRRAGPSRGRSLLWSDRGVVARPVLVGTTFDVVQTVMTGLPWSATLGHLDEVTGAAWAPISSTSFRGDEIEQVSLEAKLAEQFSGGTLFGGAARARPPSHAPEWGHGGLHGADGVPGPWHTRLPHFRLSSPILGSGAAERVLGASWERRRCTHGHARAWRPLAPVLQVAEYEPSPQTVSGSVVAMRRRDRAPLHVASGRAGGRAVCIRSRAHSSRWSRPHSGKAVPG